MTHRLSSQALIDKFVQASGAADAPAAVRAKARALLDRYVAAFGQPDIPINLDVLASLSGIMRSDEPPQFSDDAELIPNSVGGVSMRVNPDRPETRQRFSIAHEIAHTFFPDFTAKAWCRTDARYRDRSNPSDYLEMLCDVGAAELLFPLPWFSADAASAGGAAGLVLLARRYHASREATLRRYVETSTDSVALAIFNWKLKPTQKKTVGRKDQGNLLGLTPEDELRDAIRLRIEYSIPSQLFRSSGHFLPKDKSVECTGAIQKAATTGEPAEAEANLNFGQASGLYRVWALPLWTANLGPQGENAVAALLWPIAVHKPARRRVASIDVAKLFSDI